MCAVASWEGAVAVLKQELMFTNTSGSTSSPQAAAACKDLTLSKVHFEYRSYKNIKLTRNFPHSSHKIFLLAVIHSQLVHNVVNYRRWPIPTDIVKKQDI